jgi:hypothetical protein
MKFTMAVAALMTVSSAQDCKIMSVELFNEANCTTAFNETADTNKTKLTAQWNLNANGTCVNTTAGSFKSACTAEKYSTTAFKAAGCVAAAADAADDAKDTTTEWGWGNCTKMGKVYFKASNARSLIAGSAAALALAASQF